MCENPTPPRTPVGMMMDGMTGYRMDVADAVRDISPQRATLAALMAFAIALQEPAYLNRLRIVKDSAVASVWWNSARWNVEMDMDL